MTTITLILALLVGTQWQLISQGGVEITTEAPITLIFEEDNRAGGSGGCNTYGSEYAVDETSITFSAPMSTMIACEEDIMAAEQAYLAALEAAASYEHTDNQLVITTSDGQELVFVPLVNLVGSTWELVLLDGEAVSGTVTLTFDEDGRLAGSGGCNGYGGSYSANAGKLYIEEVVSTLMACADETINAQEVAYLGALQGLTRYEVSDDQLMITNEAGEELVFSQVQSLADTSWQLDLLDETPVIAGSTVTLEFAGQTGAAGSGGCNQYSGSYSVTDDGISFSEVVTTERACLDNDVMAQEQAYYAALESATTYTQSADQLTITYGEGQTLVFSPRDPAENPQ